MSDSVEDREPPKFELIVLREACARAGVCREVAEDLVRRKKVKKVRVFSDGFILLDPRELAVAASADRMNVRKMPHAVTLGAK